MPYKEIWVNPKMICRCKGVGIYYTYKDQEFINGHSSYWYTWDRENKGEHEFDVRELQNYDKNKTHPQIIKEAIKLGLITNEGLK